MQTDNIRIRALEPTDLEFLYRMENDTDLWLLSHTQQPFSAALLKQYIAEADRDIYEAKQFRFGIEIVENQHLIGFIDLFEFDPKNKRAGVGIIIEADFQQKGYGKKALKLLKDYAFNILYLHQLFANIETDNLSSIKLFESENFKLIGTKKEWNFNGKTYTDELLYQCINEKNL